MATNKLLIQDINGNVGVNTTSPGASFDVWESQSNYILDLTNASEVAFKLRTYNHGTSNVNDVAFTQGLYYSTTENSAIKFYRGSSVTGGWMTFTTNNGTERLRIDSSGNVGIGTTNPGATLHVDASSGGIVRVSRLGTGAGILQLEADGTDGTITTTNNMKFVTNGEEQMRLDTSGNLFLNAFAGRGTTSTGYLFKLNPGKVYFELMANNTTSQSDILFSDGASGDYGIIGYNHSNDSLRFYTNSTWNMTVDSQGRVGIGITEPSTKLHVRNDIVTADTTTAGNLTGFYAKWSGANTGFRISYLPNTAECFVDSTYDVTPGTIYGDINFRQNVAGTLTSRLYIKADGGNVGIGTTNPFSKLQVGSRTFNGGNGMFVDGRVGISNHGNLTGLMLASTYNEAAYPEYGLVFVQGPSTSNYNVWSLSPDGPARGNSLNFIYGANETNIHVVSPKVVFRGDGNVGLGTTSPNIRLQVVSGTGAAYSATASKSSNMFGISVVGTANENTMQGIWFASGSAAGTHWSGIAGSRQQYTTDWSTKLLFFTHDENSSNLDQATEKMVITGGGSVGIGTPTPGTLHKLAVQGPGRIKRLQKQIYNWYTTAGNSYVHVKTNLLLVSGQVGMWVWRLYGYSYGGAKIVDAYYGLHSDGSGNIYSGAIQNQGNIAFGTNMYKSTDNYLVLVGLVDSTYFFGFDIDVHHTMDYGYSDLSIISITQSASSTGAF